MPTKATPPLPLAVGESPETPFSTKKVKTGGGGESQKSKGFFWWGAARLAVLGGVATSVLWAKMGSSEFKKSLQICILHLGRPNGRLFIKQSIERSRQSIRIIQPRLSVDHRFSLIFSAIIRSSLSSTI